MKQDLAISLVFEFMGEKRYDRSWEDFRPAFWVAAFARLELRLLRRAAVANLVRPTLLSETAGAGPKFDRTRHSEPGAPFHRVPVSPSPTAYVGA